MDRLACGALAGLMAFGVAKAGLDRPLLPYQGEPSEPHEMGELDSAQATGEALSEREPSYLPFSKLWPVRIIDANGGRQAEVRLYKYDGQMDPAALDTLDDLLADRRDPENVATTTMDRRVIQVMYRAAYHFQAHELTVISGFRKAGSRSEGLHALGRAIDFRLQKVPPGALASYLRETARAGVGVYTHPATQYVHLDVRPQSYHWADGSGPGHAAAEWSLGQRGLAELDASYEPGDDWPEGTRWSSKRSRRRMHAQLWSLRTSEPRP